MSLECWCVFDRLGEETFPAYFWLFRLALINTTAAVVSPYRSKKEKRITTSVIKYGQSEFAPV